MYWANITILMVIFLILDSTNGITRPQLKKTLTMFKTQCISKIGVAEDKVKNIEKGEFIVDKDVMCYMACVYKSIQVIKNNRFDKDSINKQVDILFPQEMKTAVKAAVEKCYHVQDAYPDLCEAVFHSIKCLYEKDPENFVFP